MQPQRNHSQSRPIWRIEWLALGVLLLAVVGFWLWPSQSKQEITAATARSPKANATSQPSSWSTGRVGTSTAAIGNDPRAALVNVDGESIRVLPNARGEYHRLRVPSAATITAAVPFPGANPGDVIDVETEDGGLLQGAGSQGTVVVNSARRAPVDYRAGGQDGLYRVTLRRGGETRVLEFWVGRPPPVAVRIPPGSETGQHAN